MLWWRDMHHAMSQWLLHMKELEDSHGALCYFCGTRCVDTLVVALPNDTGKIVWHHTACVMERLAGNAHLVTALMWYADPDAWKSSIQDYPSEAQADGGAVAREALARDPCPLRDRIAALEDTIDLERAQDNTVVAAIKARRGKDWKGAR